MQLLRLPPETLKQIFEHVGSSFFREDLSRLIVCKQWFEFARPVCFKDITLSHKTLRSLVSSGGTERSTLLQDSLETLDLELGGHQPWISPPCPLYASEAPVSIEDARDDPLIPAEPHVKALDDDLARLAIIARRSRKLHTLRIRALSSSSSGLLDGPEDYLSLPTMRTFLSVENLGVLVLDLFVGFVIPSGERGDGGHICPAIGALLCTLKTLHLRMRSICPDVLKPRDPAGSLRLNVVAISLSLTFELPGITRAAHSTRCGHLGGGLLQLKGDIQKQAEALAAQMKSPKSIRILTHSLPSIETLSLDVLTGKTMKLDDDMAWDEDGKTVSEDPEPDSDFIDSDFSNFSDE
ncbi:hypothetical protein FZEAL_3397 [Fusarium zealandicum]|uniref:F-box domain-containing protein n=1 Tax=Fusarium zealandicum TaxID=1053134 RepID=A0A8H4UPH5_9HYPO|nr:hypothetical protein FZEAL_3397 [Fusarium zealandicum]